MRLLNTSTLQLELFEGGPRLSYAILSHTWGDDEVTFHDLATGRAPQWRAAWAKITACCAEARAEGYRYVWVDTCCIDKSSSAELSEAINSMFAWYRDAEVCYAYLADVGVGADGSDSGPHLEESRWLTRGWTLQELLAPPDVVFFSASWRMLGTRDSLASVISATTKIDVDVLTQRRRLSSFSVAQRLSWAARRQTTKVEDEAYCLMGLFGVSMPLLYGEGHKAFKRLQLEIMKECYDPTILAWASADSYATIVGVLASSPAAFEGCETVEWALGGSGLAPSDYGSAGACHDVIGSSLRMHADVLTLGEHETDIKLIPYDESTSYWRSPLDSLMHFPRGSSYALSPDFFEFSYLRHEKYSLILALLSGCRRGGHTVGITLCRDSTGLLKRVHYPTRFLVPDAAAAARSSFQPQTLHASLSGSETLQKPLVPAWTRCLVRIIDGPLLLSSSPYALSHTVPATAPDAENCWYLNRWSEAVDRATMTAQPCFSLHRPGVGRAAVFRHAVRPELSFRLMFFTRAGAVTKVGDAGAARPLNLCVEAEVGAHVLGGGGDGERATTELLDGCAPEDGRLLLPPSPVRRFSIADGYEVVVKFRRSQQAYTLAIVQVFGP